MFVVDIIEPKPPFDAQAAFVGRSVYPFDEFDLVVFYLQRDLAAYATEWADAFDLSVIISAVTFLFIVQNCRWHQRPGWTGLHTFTTRDAGAFAHGVGEIKRRIGVVPTASHADNIIDLHFTTGPHTQTTLNTRIQIDPHGHVAVVQQWNAIRFHRWKPAFTDTVCIRHVPQVTGFIVGYRAFGLISQQHLNNQLARIFGPWGLRGDHHSGDGFANA